MGFITRYFAPDLDFQTKRANLLDGQLEKAEAKITLLEKTIIDERKAKDKFCLRFADQLSKQANLPQKFVQDAEPKAEEAPPPVNYFEEERIKEAARQTREFDLIGVDGDESKVRPIEQYEQAIRARPEEVFTDQP